MRRIGRHLERVVPLVKNRRLLYDLRLYQAGHFLLEIPRPVYDHRLQMFLGSFACRRLVAYGNRSFALLGPPGFSILRNF
jgi:hypothetical protein